MTASVPVHSVTVETVTATVFRVDTGWTPDYFVTLESTSGEGAPFRADELHAFQEAVDQADMFIKLQEQIARMNWCPGCGDG